MNDVQNVVRVLFARLEIKALGCGARVYAFYNPGPKYIQALELGTLRHVRIERSEFDRLDGTELADRRSVARKLRKRIAFLKGCGVKRPFALAIAVAKSLEAQAG